MEGEAIAAEAGAEIWGEFCLKCGVGLQEKCPGKALQDLKPEAREFKNGEFGI